jgi:hypoxanthine phosphoribosyltransferase
MTKAEIDVAVQKCADRINADFVGEKIILTGILKGAFIFMTDLARKLTRPYSIYFLEASSYVFSSFGVLPL